MTLHPRGACKIFICQIQPQAMLCLLSFCSNDQLHGHMGLTCNIACIGWDADAAEPCHIMSALAEMGFQALYTNVIFALQCDPLPPELDSSTHTA